MSTKLMREIRFRAWHKERQRMFDILGWKVMHFNKYGNQVRRFSLKTDTTNIAAIESEVEIIENTSLHDKNGKEIWEGDICRCSKKGIYIVKQHPEFPALFFDGQDDAPKGIIGQKEIDVIAIEVLGNIYENPELLEATT